MWFQKSWNWTNILKKKYSWTEPNHKKLFGLVWFNSLNHSLLTFDVLLEIYA